MVSESPCAEPLLPQSMAEILSGRVKRLSFVSLVFPQYLDVMSENPESAKSSDVRLKVCWRCRLRSWQCKGKTRKNTGTEQR